MLALITIALVIAIGIGLIALLIAMTFAYLICHFRPDTATARISRIASGVIPVLLSVLGFISIFTSGDPVSGPAAQGLLIIFVICCGLLFVVWPISSKLVSVFLRNLNT